MWKHAPISMAIAQIWYQSVLCVVRAIMIMHMENIAGTAVKSIDIVSICMVYHNVIYAFLTT